MVTRLEHAVVNFDDGTIGLHLSSVAARQFAEGMNGLLRSDHAALFQHMAEDHDDRQQGRREQIAGGPGTEHGQRDQLVSDAVQTRITQAVPGRTHNRHGHQQ
ncbi:hypothetical protein D3C87_983060 [compost metagenome]